MSQWQTSEADDHSNRVQCCCVATRSCSSSDESGRARAAGFARDARVWALFRPMSQTLGAPVCAALPPYRRDPLNNRETLNSTLNLLLPHSLKPAQASRAAVAALPITL